MNVGTTEYNGCRRIYAKRSEPNYQTTKLPNYEHADLSVVRVTKSNRISGNDAGEGGQIIAIVRAALLVLGADTAVRDSHPVVTVLGVKVSTTIAPRVTVTVHDPLAGTRLT